MDGAKEDLVDMFIVHTTEEIQVRGDGNKGVHKISIPCHQGHTSTCSVVGVGFVLVQDNVLWVGSTVTKALESVPFSRVQILPGK